MSTRRNISFRVPDEQWHLLRARAEAAGVPINTYCRQAAARDDLEARLAAVEAVLTRQAEAQARLKEAVIKNIGLLAQKLGVSSREDRS